MFSSLGLFNSPANKCPDANCTRPRCLLNHDALQPSNSRSTPAATRPASAVAHSASSHQGPPQQKRPRPAEPPVVTSQSSTRVSDPSSNPVSSYSRQSVVASSSAAQLNNRPAATRTGLPMVPLSKTTPQPVSDRQKALRLLYDQFTKLYSSILIEHPSLAHDSALAQEVEISKSSSTLSGYKSAIHHAAVSISRRPPPDRVPHPSIGTLKESRAATEAAKKEEAGRLTTMRARRYLHTIETLVKLGFPDPNNAELFKSSADIATNAEGTIRACDRCKRDFKVTTTQQVGACLFHHGRLAPERQEGRRVWLYSCCGRDREDSGCEEGVHVFSDRDDDVALAQCEPYMTSEQVLKEKGVMPTQACEIVGLDCEMISTTKGSSLARLTIVDVSGNALLDEFVRPPAAVLDYNTRFSGVKEADLQSAVMDLKEVRSAACAFIGPDTIIVGHGLENDLRALRLIHTRIIDTAIVFPHQKGPPFRRALRDLVKEKLGYFIQQGTAEEGHSSLEDANAAIDVLKWKVRDDKA